MKLELENENCETTAFQRILSKHITFREIIFIIVLIACVSGFVSPPIALVLGFCIAQFIGHPYLHLNSKATHVLLQISVVGLGFGMNLESAFQAGKEGILFTIVSIFGTLVVGLILGKVLKIEKKTSYLIAAGTAICGGSAIAAISPVIKAKEDQTSVALGVIFILNSIALFLFPYVGHQLNLSQTQFGLWCAIAIHDTSSVVGAANRFGAKALEIATTVKLARALWIIPIALSSIYLFKAGRAKVKVPYFIGLFVLAMVLNSYFPFVQKMAPYIVTVSKTGLTLTLFLIGCGLSFNVLKSVGVRPMIQGVVLWSVISVIALLGIVLVL